MNSQIFKNILSSGMNDDNPQLLIKVRFVNIFSFIGMAFLFLFAITYILEGQYFNGLIEFSLGFIGLINFVYLREKKNTEFAASVVLGIMICVLIFLLTDGGLNNTGLFWFFTFPALSFFLKGTITGLKWMGILYASVMIITLLNLLGLLTLPYESNQIRQLLVSLLAVSLLIYFYEFINERYKNKINQNESELKKVVKETEEELKKRKIVEEKLTEQNTTLEQTKSATLNILEDLESEKARLKEERDKVDTIIQSIGDAVFVVDKEMNIILYNNVCAQLSGYSAEDAIGKKYSEILKFEFEDTGKINDTFIKDAIKTAGITGMTNHTVLVDRKGNKIPVSDSASAIKDKNGKVIGCVVVFRDVTIERDIDKAKTEFVSLASHQLRTPLTAIKWYVELLEDSGKLDDELKDFIKEISDGSQRMIDLVNSLLNVSRVDLGTFAIDPKPTNILDISKSVIKELHPTIADKKLKVTEDYNEEIPELNLDPKLIRIVFQNIISNAVKYTPDKGEINLQIQLKAKNVEIEVKDNGYGIPTKQQSQIFTKLFRADNIREKVTDGTGLGLYIVKSIVEQSGGTIRFKSEENKGTTFFVTLPLSGMKKKEGNKELS